MITLSEALAQAAVAAGIKVSTCYPGTPGSDVAAEIARLAKSNDIYMEWSTNERVALETAIGASLAGRRALVCTKSVGMNVLLDPLMVLTYTGTHGGLVILLGDDPGGYGSQNDQDTRFLAEMAELPILEPTRPEYAPKLMRIAFDLSENYNTPVIFRVTRTLNQQMLSNILLGSHFSITKPSRGLVRDPYKFFPYPANAVALHRDLHERLDRWRAYADQSGLNPINGMGPLGIIAAGFAAQKLRDVLGGEFPAYVRLLELTHLYPLPAGTIDTFLSECESVLIIEENEPFVEKSVKAFAQESGFSGKIYGKMTGHLPSIGELFRWHIQKVIIDYLPNFIPPTEFLPENESAERPARKSNCNGCPYDEVLDVLDDEIRSLGQDPYFIVDPGCLVTLAGRVDAKYAIGSAIAVADGLRKAGAAVKPVAMLGDSAFFHSTLPALCNAAVNGSDVLIIVVNNHGAVTTGSQPGPNIGQNATGDPAPVLDIPMIARACGVSAVESIEWAAGGDGFRSSLRKTMKSNMLALIELRVVCEK